MPHDRCIDCGVPAIESHLSKRGLCFNCACQRVKEAIRQMSERKGPIYDKYMERLRCIFVPEKED